MYRESRRESATTDDKDAETDKLKELTSELGNGCGK